MMLSAFDDHSSNTSSSNTLSAVSISVSSALSLSVLPQH